MASRRVVILIHGVHSGEQKSLDWFEPLADAIRYVSPSTTVVFFMYGWTAGVSVRFPGIGKMVRRHLVRKLQKAVARLVETHGAEAEIDAIAHSFGTWLLHRSMTAGRNARWHCFYRRLVYMGGVVSSRETFENEAGHFARVLNLYSRGDDVVRLAPFGHCGTKGFSRAPAPVVSVDLTPINHRDYTGPGEAWSHAVPFLTS